MTLDNFRVIILDELNVTFEEYKDVYNPITKTTTTKWSRVGGYYGSMERCLNALKDYIIRSYMAVEDYEEVLNKIQALKDATVEVSIKPDARRKDVQ